jgi:hypothetical protein
MARPHDRKPSPLGEPEQPPDVLRASGRSAAVFGQAPPATDQLEAMMPYLFWAVVPFKIMRMWWDACEHQMEQSR